MCKRVGMYGCVCKALIECNVEVVCLGGSKTLDSTWVSSSPPFGSSCHNFLDFLCDVAAEELASVSLSAVSTVTEDAVRFLRNCRTCSC